MAEFEAQTWCLNKRPLALRKTIEAYMEYLQGLQASEPERARELVGRGDGLRVLAQRGDVSGLADALRAMPRDEILPWFSVKMAQAAAAAGQARCLSFLLSCGLDVSLPPLKYLMHEFCAGMGSVARDAVPQQDVFNCIDAMVATGADVNASRKGDWYTPLHVACQAGSVAAVRALLRYNADINAVGDGDAMPLTLAEEAEANDAVPISESIVTLLVAKGARNTWRRNPAPPRRAPGKNEVDTGQTFTTSYMPMAANGAHDGVGNPKAASRGTGGGVEVASGSVASASVGSNGTGAGPVETAMRDLQIDSEGADEARCFDTEDYA
mmetsp:Transcript_45942/g.143777  ORF Transcript_45942/g.143777 Transcript_45942/m.143777 type:complete len:325 (-) Transcript_45942:43-1017(-)